MTRGKSSDKLCNIKIMNIKKYILTACIGAIAMSASILNAMTPEEKEYIKLYGMIMAEQSGLKQLGFNEEEFKVFQEGLAAGFKNAEMPKEAMAIAQKMGEYLTNRAEEVAKKDLAERAVKTEEFWKKINAEADIQKSPSGLAYKIIEAGVAPLPKADSQVVIKYTGKLIDGTVFDTSDRAPAGTATFGVGDVIPGFAEGLQKVGKGGKATLYIPADLAYGANDQRGIPANSTLVFEIEIVDVLPAAVEAPAAE